MCSTYYANSCLEAGRCALFLVQKVTLLFIQRFSLLFLETGWMQSSVLLQFVSFFRSWVSIMMFSIFNCLDSTSVTAVQLVHKFRKRQCPLDHDVHQHVHGGSWLANPLSVRLITPFTVFHTHCNSQNSLLEH